MTPTGYFITAQRETIHPIGSMPAPTTSIPSLQFPVALQFIPSHTWTHLYPFCYYPPLMRNLQEPIFWRWGWKQMSFTVKHLECPRIKKGSTCIQILIHWRCRISLSIGSEWMTGSIDIVQHLIAAQFKRAVLASSEANLPSSHPTDQSTFH